MYVCDAIRGPQALFVYMCMCICISTSEIFIIFFCRCSSNKLCGLVLPDIQTAENAIYAHLNQHFVVISFWLLFSLNLFVCLLFFDNDHSNKELGTVFLFGFFRFFYLYRSAFGIDQIIGF